MSLTENLGFKKSITGGFEKLNKDNDNFRMIDSEISYLKSIVGKKEGLLYIDNPIDFIGALVPNEDFIFFNGAKYENKIKDEYAKIIITKDINLKGFNSQEQYGIANTIVIPSHIKEILSRNATIDFDNKFVVVIEDFITIREIALQNIGNGTTAIDTEGGFLTLYNVVINKLNGSIKDSYNYTELNTGDFTLEQANCSNINNVVINGIANNIVMFRNISNISNTTLNLLRTDINKTSTVFHSVANVNSFSINYDFNENYTHFKGLYLTCGSLLDLGTYNLNVGGLINSTHITTNNCSIGGLVGNRYIIKSVYDNNEVNPLCLNNVTNLFIDVVATTKAEIANCCNIYINTRTLDEHDNNNILYTADTVSLQADYYTIVNTSYDYTRKRKLVNDDITLHKYDREISVLLSDKPIEITIPDGFLNVYEFDDVNGLAGTYNITIKMPDGYLVNGDTSYVINENNANVLIVFYNNAFYVV